MATTSSTRSVDDTDSDTDDAISQDGSQYQIEAVDDDNDSDDDDESSFEEEVLEEMETSYDERSIEQDAYDEALLEEEEVAMANGGEETKLNRLFDLKRFSNQYDLNHDYDMIRDEMKDDFNPLSVLEKESQQQRKKTIDASRTRKMPCVLDALQSMKGSNAAISRLRFSHQARKQRTELTASSSQMKRTGKSGREVSYLVDDEESVFEESICSESSVGEFSVSTCSVSTSADAQEKIPSPLEHQVETPRINNRKGESLSKLQSNVKDGTQKRNLLGAVVSTMLHSSSMKGNDVKVAPQSRLRLDDEEVSVSSKGTSNSSSKVGGNADSTNIGYLNSIASTTASATYQPPIIMDAEKAHDIISSTKSVASQKSLSSKSTASSTAKRAHQLISDIESGSKYVKVHKTYRKKRSRVLIGGLLMIFVVCVAAVLAVLHILPRQTKNDVKDIRDSETPTSNDRGTEHAPKNESDVSGMDPSAWPTFQPSALQNSLESVWLYYANWGTSMCTKEDSRTKKAWDIGYETEIECCAANFGWDYNRNCDSGENDTASSGGDIDVVLTSSDPTILTVPTADAAVEYYANFVAGKCVQDDSTQTNGKYQESYQTEEECCRFNFSWDVNGICYMEGGESTLAPTTPTYPPDSIQVKYYADWVSWKCVPDDSTQLNRNHQESYQTEEECCEVNFSWDANGMCYMVGESTTAPTTLKNADSRIYDDGVPSDFVPT
jgi:hypothetical protein